MAELTPKERLQPSLLDRLTDEEPDKQQESREKRVLSIGQLRDVVMRDLTWLLNSANLGERIDLDACPLVEHSVLNYGLPDLSGLTASSLDVMQIENTLRQSLQDFEPRLLKDSIQVRVVVDEGQMSLNTLTFGIEGELWAQPANIRLFLKTDVDLESGHVTVSDQAGQRTG